MFPSTFAGLLVAVMAILPGAVYVWSYERQFGAFNAALTDRLVRFLGVSAAVQFLAAWPEYLIYRVIRARWPEVAVGQFALAWLFVGLVVAVPAIAGTILGRRDRAGRSTESKIGRFLAKAEQPTRAWDKLFSRRAALYLRIQTSSGAWVGGLFASESYAGGAPSAGDLLLEEAWILGSDNSFERESGERLYIPAEKIEYIEIQDTVKKGTSDVEPAA